MNVPKIRFKADDGSEFPEWEEKRLGDVGTVAMCKRVFKEQTSENGEVPFFKIGTFGDKPDAYISYKLFDELRTKYPYPKKGTVLLSASGTVGRQVIYNGEDAYYQDSNIVWLEHDDTIMDGFLKQFYSIVKWKGLEGSTIKRLYNKTILDTIFYLPSLPEQSKIADFLSTIDEIIQSTESELTEWQERKKGVMQKIFSREVRFKADDGSEFPEWEEKRLGEVLQYEQPTKYIVKSEEYSDDYSVPVLTAGQSLLLGYTNELDGVYGASKDSPVIIFDDFTTSFHWVEYPFKVKSSAMKLLTLKSDDVFKYVYYTMCGIPYVPLGHSRQWIGTYSKFMVAIPSLPEQRKIADCLSSLDDVINQIKAELSAWKEFKKGLLQQMFV